MSMDAFLLSDVLEAPAQLHRDRATTIGRDLDSDVVVPSGVVSRRHALVRWDGAGFVLFDLGSTNGTFLNGKAVVLARLEPGDVVGVGPFDLRLVTTVPALRDGVVQETSVLACPGSFAGEVGPVAIGEVWQLLELNQKTGLLEVRSGARRGTVWFSEGEPLHAQCGDLVGNAAALELLSTELGRFRFATRETIRTPRTIRGTSACLLLESARLADEKRAQEGADTCSL